MPDLSTAPLPEVHPPLKFPYSVVWTHIPVISWLLPMIGHVGVCNSTGTIHDFVQSQAIHSGGLSFGEPLKYWQLRPSDAAGLVSSEETTDIRLLEASFDNALAATNRVFVQHVYNFFGRNCHSYAGAFLSQIRYGGHLHWTNVQIAAAMFVFGRYVDNKAIAQAWGPTLVILALTVTFISWQLALAHAGILVFIYLVLRLKAVYIKKDVPAIYRAATV